MPRPDAPLASLTVGSDYPPRRRLSRVRLQALAWVMPLAAALGVAGWIGQALGLSGWAGVRSLMVFAGGSGLMLVALHQHEPAEFGAGNAVTLLRLMLVAWLAGFVGEAALRDSRGWTWALVVVATGTACLDALDGPLARARHTASGFGARFDMETDAAMVMVLSALVATAGRVGPWVLAAGLMRYAYVLAMRLWPWLAQPVFPSLRRKAICVVVITGLIVCLGPTVPPVAASALAGLMLALLVISFGLDVIWLWRQRPSS